MKVNPYDINTYKALDPAQVSVYLRVCGWKVVEESPAALEWEKDGNYVLMMRTVTSASEYPLRTSELIQAVSRLEGRGRVDVIRDITRDESVSVFSGVGSDPVVVPSDLTKELRLRGICDVHDLSDGCITSVGVIASLQNARARLDALILPQSADDESLTNGTFWAGNLLWRVEAVLTSLEEGLFQQAPHNAEPLEHLLALEFPHITWESSSTARADQVRRYVGNQGLMRVTILCLESPRPTVLVSIHLASDDVFSSDKLSLEVEITGHDGNDTEIVRRARIVYDAAHNILRAT